MMEKTIGIHRDWVQPSFYASRPSKRWFKKRAKRTEGSGRRMAGSSCSPPAVSTTTIRSQVARRSRCSSAATSGSTSATSAAAACPTQTWAISTACAGTPERNVADLLPYVEAGATVVVPGPSCSLLLKNEYPAPASEPTPRGASPRPPSDLMEYLYDLAQGEEDEPRLRARARHRRLPGAVPPARTRTSASAARDTPRSWPAAK